jgi:hypothetical protein
MKFLLTFTGILVLLLGASLGSGAPLKGSRSFEQRVSGQSEGSGKWEFTETFRGGRRACVIARGDHKPVVDVGVYVYDGTGRLVAKDDGRGDYAAAIWYPPRDGTYKIVIHNAGNEWNACYIAVK